MAKKQNNYKSQLGVAHLPIFASLNALLLNSLLLLDEAFLLPGQFTLNMYIMNKLEEPSSSDIA